MDIPSSFESGYLISEADSTDADRPQEGDAIYHPILGKLFEINFVDHDQPFHQLDNNPVYKMSCRLFEYGSEILDTDIAVIDAIEDAESLDALTYQFTLEQSATTTINQEIRIDQLVRVVDYFYLIEQTVTEQTLVTISLVRMKLRVVSPFFLRTQRIQVPLDRDWET